MLIQTNDAYTHDTYTHDAHTYDIYSAPNGLDAMINHGVGMFKERLKCTCGADMAEDEFLRKYHPIPCRNSQLPSISFKFPAAICYVADFTHRDTHLQLFSTSSKSRPKLTKLATLKSVCCMLMSSSFLCVSQPTPHRPALVLLSRCTHTEECAHAKTRKEPSKRNPSM